jgi:hypothetical protein
VSIATLLAFGLCVLSAVLLVRLAPSAISSWRIYSGAGRRRQKDAGRRAPSAPPGIEDRVAILAASGYHGIGVTSLDLPVGERFAWIVAADDAESYAILAGGLEGSPMTGLYSAWPDGTWLGTVHPRGDPVDRPGLQIRIVTTSLGEAVAEHLATLTRIRTVHGDPRPVRRLEDMLMLDADYRVRFGGQPLRALTMRNIVPAVLAAATLLVAILLLLATWR